MNQTAGLESLRLFVAVELQETVKDALGKLQERLQRGAQFTGAHPTWVNTHNLHITLAFLGNQPADHIRLVGAAMEQVARRASPLKLRLKGLELFPNAKAPKVLSIEIHGQIRKLETLQGNLSNALEHNGFILETRPFRPHLTLARIKSAKGVAGLRDLTRSHSAMPAGEFIVSEIVLFQSTLTANGPVYKVLLREPLTGSEEAESLAI